MIRRAETRADLEAHSACWSAVWPEDVVSVEFILDRCLEHARSVGGATALGTVREDERTAVAFVLNREFEVMDRVVSLALDLDPAMATRRRRPKASASASRCAG